MTTDMRWIASSLAVVATLAPGVRVAVAQVSDLPLVAQSEARSHLTRSTTPAYPLLAGAAGIQGPVHFELDVSADGRVTSARVMHGSPLLEQAATDAVLAWRFSPIEVAGQRRAFRTSMMVTFAGPPLPADVTRGLMLYGDALLVCTELARRRAHPTAERRCHLAGLLAERFSATDRLLGIRPRRLQAEALLELGYRDEAVRLFEQVDARMRAVPFFSLDRALALRSLGRAYAGLGRLDDAMRAYGQAERQLADALDGAPRRSPFRAELIGYLKGFAADYSGLLARAGRPADAARVSRYLAAAP